MGFIYLPPILACQGAPSLDSVCAPYVNDRFEYRVPATQNHLPDVVQAVYSDRLRLSCPRNVCATQDVEAPQLVENRGHEWLALRADVDDPAVGGYERGPFCVRFGRVELVVNGRLEVHGHIREGTDVPDGGGAWICDAYMSR